MTLSSPTKFPVRHLVAAVLALGGLAIHAQPLPSRGELLYTTHCVACHSSQMHWRNKRLAYDWDSLKMQVGLWQANTGLQWNEVDIADVAEYLNSTIYRYPRAAGRADIRHSEPRPAIATAR